ncbi:MAG: class I SAM-dependent methyltransferase [Pseudomonadota bacterium]
MKLAVINEISENRSNAQLLALRFAAPLYERGEPVPEEYTHSLWISADGLALGPSCSKSTAATRVDFMDPTLLYRLRTSGKRQGIGKAVGLDKATGISVLDATAGLGKDSLVLAYLGCEIQMLEKSPVIHALLEDGLRRAQEAHDESLGSTLQRMQLFQCDARAWFAEIEHGSRPKPDVIYLDPMFPERSKSASVKKDMALLQNLLEAERDFPGLLAAARKVAIHRVVVKRPGNKPGKDVPAPTFIVPGKSAHFEIYVNSSFSSIR